jgi:hypothetical protein
VTPCQGFYRTRARWALGGVAGLSQIVAMMSLLLLHVISLFGRCYPAVIVAVLRADSSA